MENKQKLLVLLIGGGALVLLGGRFFLLRTLLSNGDTNIQADIQNDVPLTQEDTPTQTDKIPNNKPLPTTGSAAPETGNLQTPPETFSTVSLLLPPLVDTQAVAKTNKLIEKKFGVASQRQQLDTLGSYKQALSIQLIKDQGIDIAMVPSNWVESFADRGYYIPFQDSISPLFDARFRDLVNNTSYTYLPVLLDPMVSIVHQELAPDSELTISKIQNILSHPRKTNSFYVPLLFGIDGNLRDLLKTAKVPYTVHETLLLTFIDLAASLNKSGYLSYFINNPHRDADQVALAVQQLQDGDPGCKEHPLLCMLAYQFSDIYLGTLSDRILLKNNFTLQQPQEHLTVVNFPAPQQEYPLHGRGLMINKNSPDLGSALQRTKGYLNILLDRELPSRNSDLPSADNETRQRQLLESRYARLKPYISDGKLVMGSLQDLETLATQTPLHKTLAGEYDISIYIDGLTDY